MSTLRRTATSTALLLGATLLAPTGSATASDETCRGETATIVGTGASIQGTEGRDVIVTGGSVTVAAGAGDDVVCVRGANFNVLTVDAGAGDDVVDGTALPPAFYLTTILGDGADTFIGGVGNDTVTAGSVVGSLNETERDIIDTGDGPDVVTSGAPGAPNDDTVRAGAGKDLVTWAGTLGLTGVLDAGADTDTLTARASGRTFDIDLAAQTITRNGAHEATFSSFEALKVVAEPGGVAAVEVLGTPGADVVELGRGFHVRTDLGGGDDHVTLTGALPTSRLELGAGTDLVQASSPDGSIRLDLVDGTYAKDGSGTASIAGVENAVISARQATVKGDHKANRLEVFGCSVNVDAGAGEDAIHHGNFVAFGDSCEAGGGTLRGGAGSDAIRGGRFADRIFGSGGNDTIKVGPARSGKNKAWGGGGNDKIQGGGDKDVLAGDAGRDRITGSQGRDVAIGGRDRDTCVAEVERSCER